jgi:hypothetical protein
MIDSRLKATSEDYYGCAFIRASIEYPAPNHPVHRAAREHKEMIRSYLRGLATEVEAAGRCASRSFQRRPAQRLVSITGGECSPASAVGQIPGRTIPCREQQIQPVRSPRSQVSAQVFDQFRRDGETTIALARFNRLDLTTPHALSNVNDAVLQVQIANAKSTNLTASYSCLREDGVEGFMRFAGGVNCLLDFNQRQRGCRPRPAVAADGRGRNAGAETRC